jgi:hypothetical protein
MVLLAAAIAAVAAAPAAVAAAPSAVAAAPSAAVHLISITLELKTGDSSRTVDPAHVFASGDTVRFRLRPAVDGYLYVLDLNTSGSYQVLFPRAETGNDNRILQGHDYLLPATDNGWFQITGPAGRERLYFVLSPIALTSGQMQQHAITGVAPSTMHPRCDDAIFRSRGDCVDDGAGPQPVAPGEPLPRGLAPMAHGASRDLTFTNNSSGSTVSSTEPLAGPVVYEFLLAHK